MCTRVPLLPASMIAIVRSGISLSQEYFFFLSFEERNQKQKRPWMFEGSYDWTEQERVGLWRYGDIEYVDSCTAATGIHDRCAISLSLSLRHIFFWGVGKFIDVSRRKGISFSFVCQKKGFRTGEFYGSPSSLLSHRLFLFSPSYCRHHHHRYI